MNRDAAQLRDEIRLREASLRDASRERDEGELTAEQFDAIERREGFALEVARNELGALMVSVDVTPARRRIRRARWLVVAVTCFALVLIYTLFSSTSPRQAGTPATAVSISRVLRRSTDCSRQAEVDVANSKMPRRSAPTRRSSLLIRRT